MYILFGLIVFVILCIIAFEFSHKSPNDKKIVLPQIIPKIIIQTWKSNNIPDRYIPLIKNIKNNNPDYEYKLFTDEDIEYFLKSNYSEYYETYKNLPIKIQKIDYFRYIAIYHYGGFYMDLDMDGLENMDDLLHHRVVFPIDEYITKQHGEHARYKEYYINKQPFLLGQYAFAAEPNNKFIKEIIDNIHKNINNIVKRVNHNDDEYVYKTTGPDYISSIYMNSPYKKDVHILDNGKRQYFGNYAQHKYFGTWK